MSADADVLLRRLERERAIRREAERIAERSTRELYDRQEELVDTAGRARRLLADALDAEDRARRRLARTLHDTTLQTMLAAAQDLDEALEGRGDRDSVVRGLAGIRVAVTQMREVLRGIHPPALDHVGLGVALAELAREAGEHGPIADARSTIRDDATQTVHDELVMVLARELVRNVVEHAQAGRLELSLIRDGDHLRLLVADDGLGIPPGRRELALAGGHLGIASCAERAATVGGRMTVSPNGRWPVPGTRVEVVLPL